MRGIAHSTGRGLASSWLVVTTSLLAGGRLCGAITLNIDDPGMFVANLEFALESHQQAQSMADLLTR